MKLTIMLNEFYEFIPEDRKGCVRLEANVKYGTLSMLNNESPLLKSDVIIKRARGKNWYDVIQFDDSSFFVVSERVKELFVSKNITGLQLAKVNIVDAPVNYYLPIITSIAGPILNLDALNAYETENVEFDRRTYDGSNIFSLENTLLFVCDEKVKNILEQQEITNLKFRNL
jgi:hypothetical protein